MMCLLVNSEFIVSLFWPLGKRVNDEKTVNGNLSDYLDEQHKIACII